MNKGKPELVVMLCWVADEPVVVIKSSPEKPGNGVEEKTEMTSGCVCWGCRKAKSAGSCEGGKFNRKFWKRSKWMSGEQAVGDPDRQVVKRFTWEHGTSRKLLSSE